MNGQRQPSDQPAIHRLERLSPLDAAAVAALKLATSMARKLSAHREIVAEGREIGSPVLLLEGCAARTRTFVDGSRQILSFVLPGEFIGLCEQEHPRSLSTVIACTPCLLCDAPRRGASTALDRAYAVSRALDEGYLLAQIGRIGRLDAHDRLLDLLLELMERLELAGLAEWGRFMLPLTQEQIADGLGLTSVHVNRMIQQARREGQIEMQAKTVLIRDPHSLRAQLGRRQAGLPVEAAARSVQLRAPVFRKAIR